MYQDEYNIQDDIQDPLAYLYRSDLDTIHFDQSMKELDRKEFINSAIRGVNRHCEMKHWNLLPRKDAPKGQPILDLVWAMKRKRGIVTRQVYKWKATLNLYREQKEYGVNYLEN